MLSILHVYPACSSCMAILHVNVSMLTFHAACPCCLSIIYFACLFSIFMLHVHGACPSSLIMSPCCMSMLHVRPGCSGLAAWPEQNQGHSILHVFTSFNATRIACPCERVQWVSISFQIVVYDTQKARIVTIFLFARLMKSEYVLLPNFSHESCKNFAKILIWILSIAFHAM